MTGRSSHVWQRLGELFDQAVTLPEAERLAFLSDLAGADATLRDDLEKLLAADSASGVLDRAVHDVARHVDPFEADTLIGKQVGNWRIGEVIGHGGMGAVYRAERADGAYTQNAALKLIRFGVDSVAARSRFLRERQFLASLQHPHIATLLDGGVMLDGTPYLAMELVDGERIDAFCDAHGLTIVQRLHLMLQVLAAVQHAHQRLIVHRDLKPSNILVTGNGTAKLLDFGIATAIDASGAATATRDHPLTPAYAAPEQLNGQPVTTSTDVYSLGIVLAQLIGGVAPRVRRNKNDSYPLLDAAQGDGAANVAAARGIHPRQLVHALRGDLGTIVQRALAPDPARRYQGAQALATDIEHWLAGRPITARPDSWLYRTNMFVRRHRVGVALSAATVLALFAATAFSIQQAGIAREAARDAEARALSLRAVSDTLDNMLHPEQFLADVNGPASTARLLRHNIEALDFFLADQPLTRASLLWRHGRGLRLAGDDVAAVKVLRAANEAYVKADASTSLDGREATLELSRAQIGSGDAASAAVTLDALEGTLRDDEVNVDLRRHAIAQLRANMALTAGRLDEAEKHIVIALKLAPAPSGEHGARYGVTSLLAGTIRLAQGEMAAAGDAFADAFEAMTADPRAEFAPPHQPLAPAVETLARLGDAQSAGDYATRWHELRAKYFGAESAQARKADELRLRLGLLTPSAADPARALRLRKALAAYWQANFEKYDIYADIRSLSLDRDL